MWKFTGNMNTTNVHHEVGSAWAVSGNEYQGNPGVIKLGVDVHQGSCVVVAKEDHATARPAQRFLPSWSSPEKVDVAGAVICWVSLARV